MPKQNTKQVYPSEAAKWRHIVAPYCVGNGVEIATGGDPIVPHAIQIELPEKEYAYYNSNQPLRGVVHYRSTTAALDLPFKDKTLDWVASSHLLEDFLDWTPILKEWVRVLKYGGRLIICVPDKKRWAAALAAGQPPNLAHRHESYVGELSEYAPSLGLTVEHDGFTESPKGDYNIFFCGRKGTRV